MSVTWCAEVDFAICNHIRTRHCLPIPSINPQLKTRSFTPTTFSQRPKKFRIMIEPIKTLLVPHLGGIDVGHRLSAPLLDPAKPTLVLFNPFTTTADYYLPQFEDKGLTDALNLVAIEPLGHGITQLKKTESFTYWDSAIMSLQLLDALEIDKVFASGTSQGGWIATRMALLAPDRV